MSVGTRVVLLQAAARLVRLEELLPFLPLALAAAVAATTQSCKQDCPYVRTSLFGARELHKV